MKDLHLHLERFLSTQKLPGEEAHAPLAPHRRARTSEFLDRPDINPRESAVMILIYPHNGRWSNVLIRRPEYDGTHSGQVSFPGGRVEDEDDGLEMTALRETHEEIGVSPEGIQVLGKISQVYIPPSNFLVQPYVGYLPERPKFAPDPFEVAGIIEHDILEIRNEGLIKETDIRLSNNMMIKAPYFDIDGHVVWGATAIMLSEVRQILLKL